MCSKHWVTLFHTMSFAMLAKRKKVIATLLGRLTCHPMREQTVLEAKYLEQADQWVPASQFAIQ